MNDPKNKENASASGVASFAMFGIPVFNPLEHGIHGEPLMVPAHEWNKLASAVQSVIDSPDYTNPEGIIRRLKDSLPNTEPTRSRGEDS